MAYLDLAWVSLIVINHRLDIDPGSCRQDLFRPRSEKAVGFRLESEVHLAPIGARAIFEGQVRFSQIQHLYWASGKSLTWEEFKQQGMLHGIYSEAFDAFLKLTGAAWRDTPADPIVGLFLLVCDLSINPNAAGFPCDLANLPSFIEECRFGAEVLADGYWPRDEGESLLGAITQHSKEEYLKISADLCAASGRVAFLRTRLE